MSIRIVFLLFACLLPCLPVRAQDPTPPRVMLATGYHAGIEVSAYRVSEKLDGVRGYWDGQRLRTRAGHPVTPPDWFTANWPAVPMDGELWIARGRFDEVSGIARASTADDAAWRQVRFMVFDLPAHGGRFEQRVAAMQSLLGVAGVDWLKPVRQLRFDDAAQLDQHFAAVVAAGGEGLMLHHRDARYRAGRSDTLLKYKPFQDAEAQVVGHTPGRGKYTGMLGALIMERSDGVRFHIGSGLSDALRASPPSIGSHVTYRYNGLTANGLPRFARFLRVRHELPPPDPE